MTGNPTKVSHAAEAVVGVNVEGILDGESSTEEEATNGVHDTLWLTGRARGLEQLWIRDIFFNMREKHLHRG